VATRGFYPSPLQHANLPTGNGRRERKYIGFRAPGGAFSDNQPLCHDVRIERLK
jgi:hypothetical protein